MLDVSIFILATDGENEIKMIQDEWLGPYSLKLDYSDFILANIST